MNIKHWHKCELDMFRKDSHKRASGGQSLSWRLGPQNGVWPGQDARPSQGLSQPHALRRDSGATFPAPQVHSSGTWEEPGEKPWRECEPHTAATVGANFFFLVQVPTKRRWKTTILFENLLSPIITFIEAGFQWQLGYRVDLNVLFAFVFS